LFLLQEDEAIAGVPLNEEDRECRTEWGVTLEQEVSMVSISRFSRFFCLTAAAAAAAAVESFLNLNQLN
jgi:hypothetical protein